jgi:hypothetical protein
MAARTIAQTDTLETFRTQFNALSSSDFGDIGTLDSNITATSVIGAVNELYASIAGSLAFNITDGSNTQTISNAQTMTISGTANQVTAVVSATDTLTLGLASNLTVSGTTHALGTIAISGNTISSSNSTTLTVDDNLSLPAGKTFTADTISSNNAYVDFGAKNLSTSGFYYTSAASGGIFFEGATANDFETKIVATDPTADRTITLPDASGTLLVSGGTGTVSGTTIANDTVTEANMADDAIGQDQLKSVVTLQIVNSSGTVVKTMYGAGA